MEIKKSPKADLENKRSLFTLVGLVLALGFTYICFEWTNTEVMRPDANNFSEEMYNDSEELPPPSEQNEPHQEVKAETPPPQIVTEIKVVENDKETKEVIIKDPEDKGEPISEALPPEEEEQEDTEEIFTIVEKKADFPGGTAKLMDFLKKELNYPQVAIDNNIQGRVYVEFVVNKDGSIQDVKVARGVDPSLDNEAIRVVKKMPKWTPAEQRGKTCRSRFTLPVLFKFK